MSNKTPNQQTKLNVVGSSPVPRRTFPYIIEVYISYTKLNVDMIAKGMVDG